VRDAINGIPAPSGSSHFVVVGLGYTGLRALNALPADRTFGIGRAMAGTTTHETRLLDLDRPDDNDIKLPAPCTVLYTVPPATDATEDRRLAAFLSRIRPTPVRFVYLSTSGVYGDRGGKITCETDPTNPTTDRAKRRFAAEQYLEQWCQQTGCEPFVLRVPGIYGPGRLGLEPLRQGAAIVREADSGPGNRIHVDDLVASCLAAMTSDASPGTYNVADADHRSNYWFRRTVAELAGLPVPREISLEEARHEWGERRASFLQESRLLDTQKFHRELKVALRYTNAEDGIRASLAEEALALS